MADRRASAGLVRDLRRLVQAGRVLGTLEDRRAYAYDATFHEHLPDAVVIPGAAAEVGDVLRLADRLEVPVVVRGAGTGLSGGSVPLAGGIVLAMTAMNRVLGLDEPNMVVEVEPGVVTGDLHRLVEGRGLFYPPDPASSDACTIGGNIGECAGGPRCLKYGVTRDYLLGLEAVLPGGDVIRCGARTPKHVTGYDLTRLFCGSEGTLGVVTRALLRLVPRPAAVSTGLAVFDSLVAAGEAVAEITGRGIIPATLELMDAVTIRCVNEYVDTGLPDDCAAVLLVEVDGEPEVVARQAEAVAAACRRRGAREVGVARNEAERGRLWLARRSVSSAIVRRRPVKVSEDVAVPRQAVPSMVARLQDIRERHGLELVVFGHAGDGNLHPNILIEPHELERVGPALAEILQAAVDLGGTLTGEHGIGCAKAPYLHLELDEATRGVLRRIKGALDPKGIMNPQKIFG